MVACVRYVNQTKIKGGCRLEIKAVPHDYKSALPLSTFYLPFGINDVFEQFASNPLFSKGC